MTVDKFELRKVLALDSLSSFLSQLDRSICHKASISSIEKEELPLKVRQALIWIQNYQWEPPERKYEDSRTEIYYDEDTETWKRVKFYKHEILTKTKQI